MSSNCTTVLVASSCGTNILGKYYNLSGTSTFGIYDNSIPFKLIWLEAPNGSGINIGDVITMSNGYYHRNCPYYIIETNQLWLANTMPPGNYRYQIINPFSDYGCPITRTISVQNSRNSSSSNAGTDQLLPCGDTQTNLAANDPLLTPPNWGQGRWSLVSGPNAPVIADIYDRNTAVTNMIGGEYFFKWTILGGGNCSDSEDIIRVIVSNSLNLTLSAGNDITTCANTLQALTATSLPSGNLANLINSFGATGVWSQISGPIVTLTTNSLISASTSPLQANSVFQFMYTVSNACGVKRDTVRITTNNTNSPSPAEAGGNQW
jgi:hypothetical protein